MSGTDLTIIEDDAKGIVLSRTAVSPTEGETTGGQYTVRLASEPTGTVTVHADAPAGSDVRVASSGAAALTASLTFTTGNWDEPQSFTVTAVDDADSADDTGLAISHRVGGGGVRVFHDWGLRLPVEIDRLADLWRVSGGGVPRKGDGGRGAKTKTSF